MTVLIFIIILAILVLVHELGHFIAAKKNGVLVEEFGFGFPPRIFGIKKGETLYSINAIPLGGFVKVYGEEYHEEDISKVKSAIERNHLKNRAFIYKKPWQKVIIVISGVIGNFLLGWILISFLFTQGVPVPTQNVIVEKIQKGSPAHIAGLKEHDAIVKIGIRGKETPVKTAEDLVALAKKYAGEPITLTVSRDKQVKTIAVTPRKKPPAGEGPLGIAITSFTEKKYPWYQAPFYGLLHAASMTYRIIVEIAKTLFQLLTFHAPSADVAGPIGIAQFTGRAIKFGNNAVLELIALLSLNLAVINIFPFPALDGGRLIFILYEWVTKKRVNKTFEKYINLIGFVTLLSLAVLISINDLAKIYR